VEEEVVSGAGEFKVTTETVSAAVEGTKAAEASEDEDEAAE